MTRLGRGLLRALAAFLERPRAERSDAWTAFVRSCVPAVGNAGTRSPVTPEQRDDLAVDLHLVGPEDQVDHGGVRRAQHDLVALAGERFDRGLLAGDAGDDDVALLGGGLLADDDVVTVEDAGLDHRVAPHPQHEHRAFTGEVGREGEDLLDVLGGEDAGTGGDVTDERDVADGPALQVGARRRLELDVERPAASWGRAAGSPWPPGRSGGRAPWTWT